MTRFLIKSCLDQMEGCTHQILYALRNDNSPYSSCKPNFNPMLHMPFEVVCLLQILRGLNLR